MSFDKACKTLFSFLIPLLILDIVVKYWVATSLPTFSWMHSYFPYGGIGLINGYHGIYFSMVHTTNKGAAWGILADYQDYLLMGRMVLIGCLTIFILFINKNRSLVVPFCLIITGAIGNVLDYFLYGHVIDMWNIQAWGYNFPIFNMADVYVTIGIVWLFFLFMFEKKKIKPPKDIDYSSY
ncbi:MAG: signal peptidase II [Parachlamydiales bacterium]|nr:signal peptidase II [Parachlamydiales bacterium]